MLKTVAFKSDGTTSEVATAKYAIAVPATPTPFCRECFTPPPCEGCGRESTFSEQVRSEEALEGEGAASQSAPINVYLYAGEQITENVTMGYFYYQDSLGNTSHVTDAAGNLLEHYTYSAFGIPTILSANNTQLSTSAYGIRHLFQGQLWTQETGLNDYRNRVELPVMGVFLQPDPIGFKGDAANLYRFCNNDAVNRTDPTGLLTRDWEAAVRAIDQAATIQFFAAERMASQTVTMAPISKSVRDQSFEQRAHREALKMLADETHKPGKTQAGLILDHPPYRVGPIEEKIVRKDKFNLESIHVGREELPAVPAGQKGIIIHYHSQLGINGNPSPDVDLERAKSTPMYFSNRDWAATGKYLIYHPGASKPDVMHSTSIIPLP